MITLPSPLPAIGGAVADRMHALHTVEDAYAFLLRERLFGIVDASSCRGLDATAQQALAMRLERLRAQMALRHAAQWHDLAPCIQALHDAGIEPIALKGAALSSRYYPSSSARPSVDIDLFISAADIDRVHAIMSQHGWHLPSGVRGEVVSGQFSYRTTRSQALATTIDFHWRITNRPRLHRALSYAEVASASVPADGHFPGTRLIAPAHALVHGIIHLVAHHHDEPICALWYVDLALLDTVLSASERRAAIDHLQRAGLLSLAATVWQQLAHQIGYKPSPETQFLLALQPTWWDRLRLLPSKRADEIIADLLALPTPLRLHYLRELFFPPPSSIRAAYGPQEAQTPLWRLYLRRLRHRGIRKG